MHVRTGDAIKMSMGPQGGLATHSEPLRWLQQLCRSTTCQRRSVRVRQKMPRTLTGVGDIQNCLCSSCDTIPPDGGLGAATAASTPPLVRLQEVVPSPGSHDLTGPSAWGSLQQNTFAAPFCQKNRARKRARFWVHLFFSLVRVLRICAADSFCGPGFWTGNWALVSVCPLRCLALFARWARRDYWAHLRSFVLQREPRARKGCKSQSSCVGNVSNSSMIIDAQ